MKHPSKMTLTAILTLFLMAGCTSPEAEKGKDIPKESSRNTKDDSLQFSFHGQIAQKTSLEALKKITKPREFNIIEPHSDGKEVTYIGFPLREVLGTIYGKKWQMEEEILFTCADGYQPSVPMDEFLTYQPYLVFDRVGGEFMVDNQHNAEKKVPLGPYYLIWDNQKDKELQNEQPSYWPYQVVAMDLIRFDDRFPKLAPPKDAPNRVKKGFAKFRKYCMSCHSVGGEGGKKGPDLAGVRSRHRLDWIRAYIDDARAVNLESKMGRLNPALRNRTEVIDRIMDYIGTI